MSTKINNGDIIGFLKENYPGTGFIDSLKIKYRSLICPFINLIEMVKPGEKVGDVGCGSGQFLLLLSHFAKPSMLFGIEISERLINNANNLFAKQDFKNYKFSTYNGQIFPQEFGEMDIIYIIDVLHHVPKKSQESFIKDLAKIMKPGARLVLKDINASSPLVYCNKMHDMVFAGEIGNEMTFNNAKELLKSSGLQIIEEQKRTMYVYPHYTLVAKK